MKAIELIKKHWHKSRRTPMPEVPQYIIDAVEEALRTPLSTDRIKLGREVYPFEALAVNEFFYARNYTAENMASIYGSIYHYQDKNPDKKFKTVKEEYKGKNFIKVIRVQ